MGGTGYKDNWVLLWWARPYSLNLESSFLLMGGIVFPPCRLALCQHTGLPGLLLPVDLCWSFIGPEPGDLESMRK